jgi:leader peptidase (prepilin peptidase)/N-methyltransferase
MNFEILRWILIVLVGWVAGILVNYLADVLPFRRKFVKPFCRNCRVEQPFANYFLWPRTCPDCHSKRSARTWIVEILFVLVSIWLWENRTIQPGYVWNLLVCTYFGVVVVIDFEHKLIMHPVSIFGAVLGAITGYMEHGFLNTILGGLVGFGVMLVFYWVGEFIFRVVQRARGEAVDDVALGFGDVNLSGVLGLMLGFRAILVGLLFAVLIGGVVSLLYMVLALITRRYQMFMALPYGPFLVAGAVLVLFFGQPLAGFFASFR